MIEEEKLTQDETIVENADISALDEQKAIYEAQLAEKDAKYASLLRAYARGERAEPSAPAEPTADELKNNFENNVRELLKNRESDIEQAKRLLAVRNYKLSLGDADIFLPQDGTPSQDDIASANNTADLLATAIENSEGDDGVFKAILQKHLQDNRNIKIMR